MEGFYEKFREDASEVVVTRSRNHVYSAHFHSSLEILLVNRGGYRVICNDNTVDVADGCFAVFDSYDVHWYKSRLTEGEADDCVLIVPYRLLSRFNARRKNLRIAAPLVRDEALCKQLLFLIDEFVCGKDRETAESAVGLILALVFDRLEFSAKEKKDEVGLMRKVLDYVQENYRGDVTLHTVARELGYTEEHVSRVFHRYAGEGLPQYVNRLRLEYIDRARADGDKRKMTELIFEAGFKSQQSYYRNKNQRSVGS